MRIANALAMIVREGGPLLKFSIDMRFALDDDMRCALQLLRSAVGPIQAKRGCRSLKLELDTTELGLVHYLEEWDEEAFSRHVRSYEFRHILHAIDLCAEVPRIAVGDFVGEDALTYLQSLRTDKGPQG